MTMKYNCLTEMMDGKRKADRIGIDNGGVVFDRYRGAS